MEPPADKDIKGLRRRQRERDWDWGTCWSSEGVCG